VAEKLLTVSQVAERLAISEAKTWQLVSTGELHSLKIDWSRRIPESAVAEFIRKRVAAEEQRTGPGSAA